MTPSMDNFTPDPNHLVDINPITWEASICKYTEHGIKVELDCKSRAANAEFRGCTSHEFRVQPVYNHTRVDVHYRSYILEHQIADEEPTYFLLEIINSRPRVSMSEDYKVMWNRAGRRKELVEKLSVWEQEPRPSVSRNSVELPVELRNSTVCLPTPALPGQGSEHRRTSP